MLASCYVKFKTGHIVAAKCVFEKFRFAILGYESSQYIKCTESMVTLCLGIYFVSVKLLYYGLWFQIKIVNGVKFTCNVALAF